MLESCWPTWSGCCRCKRNTLLAITVDGDETARFADDAEAAGWRVHRANIAGRVSCPTLVRAALESVATSYVIRIDGDTFTEEHPGRAVAAARHADADLCGVRSHVSKRERLIERLQAVEYEMSMLGRRNRPWMTSGAAMVAKTQVLKGILDHHSGWFPGEDIETGVIANHFKLRVRHIDFVFLRVARHVPHVVSPATHVVVGKLPYGVRQCRSDRPLPDHVCVHRGALTRCC